MKYYCIGIKGAGMSTLSQLLFDLGNEVSGYDDVEEFKFTQTGLDERGIKIYYDSNHDIDENTIVTFSKAFSEDHKEIQRVKNMGLTIKNYNDIVGEITDKFKTISVSGTHGKTTTSALISHILNNTKGCNFFIGDGSGHADINNKLFVIESDEFNKHFLAYHPTYSIITNIEEEHMECYKDLNDILETFTKFANDLTKEKLIVCGDNENIRKITFNKPVRYYGFNDNNDTVATNIILTKDGSEFDIYRDRELYSHVSLPLYGKHMILNALAAIEIAILEGIEKEVIINLLKEFKNAKRRFAITNIKDTVIIDDYAHHPTEIEVTIQAAKQKYPDKKIVAIFKPNTYSRTKDFTEAFINALNKADYSYITLVESNREKQEDYPNVNSHMILEKLERGEIISEDTVSKLLKHKNEVLLFMSCASVVHMIDNIKELLKEE